MYTVLKLELCVMVVFCQRMVPLLSFIVDNIELCVMDVHCFEA